MDKCILGKKEQLRIKLKGSCRIGTNAPDMYSECMNLDKGILYFTTYDNNQIDAVDMNN